MIIRADRETMTMEDLCALQQAILHCCLRHYRSLPDDVGVILQSCVNALAVLADHGVTKQTRQGDVDGCIH